MSDMLQFASVTVVIFTAFYCYYAHISIEEAENKRRAVKWAAIIWAALVAAWYGAALLFGWGGLTAGLLVLVAFVCIAVVGGALAMVSGKFR